MLLLSVRANISVGATEGVERQPGQPPTAFRIWKAGDNPTDYGVHRFTKRSAELLMQEQAGRGNLYSVDVDHMSTPESTAPPESRKAVGWHKLEVRQDAHGEPELWAATAQWTDAVASGLSKAVPEWRYVSAWYRVDKKTGEIISYMNTALTNNPATHHTTELANRIAASQGNHMEKMTYKDAMAALFGDDEEKKAAAKKCIAAAFGDGGEGGNADDDKKKLEDEDKKKKDEEAAKAAKASAEAEQQKKDEEAKKASQAAAASGAITATIALLGTDVAELAKWKADREVKEEAEARAAIKASRPDLPDAFWKSVEKLDVATVRASVAAIPGETVDPAASVKVTGTRGDDRGGADVGVVRAARLPPDQHADLMSRMGLSTEKPEIHWKGNDKVFPLITPKDALAILAKRGDAPPPVRPRLPNAREIGR